jgi:hypothetical protein
MCLARSSALGFLGQVFLTGAVTAAGLTVSPSIVTNDFNGKITLAISNLPAPGRTVIVERYADFDNDGVADASEPIVLSFRVTDGQVPTIGGVRNLNVPGDEDGAVNGQIRAELFTPGPDGTVDRIVGNFVIKVSDATPGGFAPVTQRFTIRQKTRPQGVTGKVTAASTGLPLANTFVVLLIPDAPGGAGGFTDINGDFTIHSAPGDYIIAALRPGYVVDPAATMVTVNSNQFITKDVPLSNGTFTVSGRVVDAQSGDGVSGNFVFADAESGHFAAGSTDSSGQYSIAVTPGLWEIRPNENQAALQGYVGLSQRTATNVTGNISNLDFALPKATALIYGRLLDDSSRPLSGVEMRADQSTQIYEGSGRCYPTNADYAIAVVAGMWYVGPEQDDPALAGVLIQSTNVTVSDGLAVRVDFVAQRATTLLGGRLVDDMGAPVSGIEVNICPQGQGGCFSTDTDGQGRFLMRVAAGDWGVSFSSEDLASRGLVAQSLNVTLVEGVDQTNLLAVARPTTAQINVSVRETNGTPVGGIYIFGYAQISNTSYSVYGSTDGNGAATLGVLDGQWEVNLDCFDLNERGFECVTSQSVAVSGTNATVNFVVTPMPVPQLLQFSASSYTVSEGGASAVITVVRTGPSTDPTFVQYATSGGSATPGTDYTNVSGVLVFDPGMTEETFEVPIINDGSPELPETIGLVLSNPGPGVSLGTLQAATLTILDDDAAPGPNVTWFAVVKGQNLQQDGSGAPTTNGVTNPFAFYALVGEAFPGSVSNATLRAPGGANYILNSSEDDLEFNFGQKFPTKSALDAAFPSGSYLYTLATFNDGTRTPTLSLPSELYPNAPRIANWTAAQTVDANADFTLMWDAFGGGTSDDFVQLSIENQGEENFFQTPDIIAPDSLDGTHTSVAIPAGTLAPGQTYHGRLLFAKRRSLDTNSYPPVPGITAFFRETGFSLQTVAPPPPQGQFQFDTTEYTASEASGMAQLNVRRVGGSQGQAHVTVAISGGTATPIVDYGSLSQGDPFSITLSFADGETNVAVSFPIFDDFSFDPNETVLLALRNPADGAVLGSPTNALVRIIDNDPRPDSIPPTVAITVPASGAKLSNSSVTLLGTARDNFAVTAVECRVENTGGIGDYQTATTANGWTNWTAAVTGLLPGTNTFRVRSWDDSGNSSTVASRFVTYIALSPLTLISNGLGTFSPNLNGQLLPVGLGQTVTAVPGAGYVFSNWVGGLVSTNARLTFLMESGLVLQANFVANPFNRTKGSYNGLFYEVTNSVEHKSSGFLTFSLTDRGKYSGKLQLAGKTHSFLGQFDLSGRAASTVKRSVTNAVRLELSLTPMGSSNDFTGRLLSTNTPWVAELLGDRAPIHTATNPSPYLGRYTLMIPWDEQAAGSPGGDGFGTVVVATSGRLAFAGTLGDGTPASQSVSLSKDGFWPWYVPVLGGKGSILSWTALNTQPAPTPSLSGMLHWFKPALATSKYYSNGFTFQTAVAGSAYLPPGTNLVMQLAPFGEVDFRSGNLTGSYTNIVNLGAYNRVLNLTPEQPLTLTLTLSSGRLQGAITLTNAGLRVTRAFKGAVLQRQNFGSGHFLGTNQSGRVYLGPLFP